MTMEEEVIDYHLFPRVRTSVGVITSTMSARRFQVLALASLGSLRASASMNSVHSLYRNEEPQLGQPWKTGVPIWAESCPRQVFDRKRSTPVYQPCLPEDAPPSLRSTSAISSRSRSPSFSGSASPALEFFPPIGPDTRSSGQRPSLSEVDIPIVPEIPKSFGKKFNGRKSSHVYEQRTPPTPIVSPMPPTGSQTERSLPNLDAAVAGRIHAAHIRKLKKQLYGMNLELHRDDELIRRKSVECIRAELRHDPGWFEKQIARTSGDMEERKKFLKRFGCRRMDKFMRLVTEARTGL